MPPPEAPAGAPPRAVLVPGLARGAIAERFGLPREPVAAVEWLREPGACFVTLHLRGDLRGCIGSLEPRRRLLDDLHANALAAAFGDPRFAPLAAGEYAVLDLEVSLLSPLSPLAVASEEEARAALRPRVDGLVLEWGFHRGTFLPQVWEQLPDPHDFLCALKRKAGLPLDFWSRDARLSRYTVEELPESPERPAFAISRLPATS